jgi:type II secretory pathway pseudopilin PulG
MKKQQYLAKQYGRTMVEMLGVLAIVGVLSIGAIAGYSKAMNKRKINKTIDQMTQIINNIRNVYVNKRDYSGLNNIEAVNLGVFPTEMVTDSATGKVKNLYQGDVIVSGTTDDFDVLFEGLPRDVSAQLAVTDWGVDTADLIQIKLDTQTTN